MNSARRLSKIIFIVTAIASQCAFANTLSYREAKIIADHDEASIAPLEAEKFIQSENELSVVLLKECEKIKTSKDFRPFVVVAKIDSSGKVLATWRQGDSYLAICLEKKIAEVSLFVPPRAPFYTSIEMNIEYKGDYIEDGTHPSK